MRTYESSEAKMLTEEEDQLHLTVDQTMLLATGHTCGRRIDLGNFITPLSSDWAEIVPPTNIFALLKLVFCLCSLTMSVACTKKATWLEDVRLDDGRVVTLKRHQEFGGPHQIGQPPGLSDTWLEFKHPDTGKIVRWEEKGELSVDALRIDQGIPRLIVVPRSGALMRRHCPAPPYLIFQYENGSWIEKPLAQMHGAIVKPNVTNDAGRWFEFTSGGNRHLTPEETAAGAHGHANGRRIDFGKLTSQVYGMKGCNPPFDFLPETTERK
jgi:hypothetical protein